jgi:SNF2 family DNA or RNA helicase
MLKDIIFTGEYEITFHKVLFAANEISLAKCLGFTYRIDESEIVCDLTVTSEISLIEFIKESFPRVWNNPMEQIFKESLVDRIDNAYGKMQELFHDKMLPKLGYEDKLYTHQKEALYLTVKKRFNFLAYDQGLGKTLIAASMSKMHSIKRTLIICPASLKWNWMREMCGPISKFNELYITLLDSNKSRTIKAFQERFVICNFESLDKHMAHILSIPIGHIVIDEAVKIKSTSTNNHKQCAKIIEANPTAKVTMMSGFPIRNRVVDVFAYLKIVGHPLGSNYAAFLREYAISAKGRGNSLKITGTKNTEQLWRQMSNFFIRKKKEECLDLPAKIHTKIQLSIEDYRAEYDAAVKEALEKSGKTNLNSCIHSINIINSKAKLSGIIEFIENLFDQGEKVIVFTGYTSILEALDNHFGKKCVIYNGKVDSRERDVRVERFKKDEDCMGFFANIIAGGMGLTLNESCNTVYCDLPLSPADLIQSNDRNHRIGQDRAVNYYYFMGIGSIDEHLYSLIAEKSYDASLVIDGKGVEMHNENVSEMLISKLREEYGIPELSSNGEEN